MKYDVKNNIIILGESNSGKTTLIYNYLYDSLDTKDNITTIGIDYYKKVLYNNDKSYLLNIYDTGNGLLYRNILECYLRKSEIFIIVLRQKSFRFVKEVFELINIDNKINPQHIFIIYNKSITNCDFTFNENDIIKHNPKAAQLHFSYINLLNKFEVSMFFNNFTKYIFNNTDNNNNNDNNDTNNDTDNNTDNNKFKKKSNKLIPLNVNNNNKEISSKSYSCNRCCIIS